MLSHKYEITGQTVFQKLINGTIIAYIVYLYDVEKGEKTSVVTLKN